MKFKIKYTSTRKFVLNFEGVTIDELLAKVIAFIADTYGDECDNISLSLNGKDPLPSGPNMTLAEAGVVASDLLTVIQGISSPSLPAGGAPAAGRGSSTSNQDGGSSTSAGSSGGGGGKRTGGEKTPVAATAASKDDVAAKPLMFVPSSLLDVQAINLSTATVPESLSHALSSCRPQSSSQLVNILAHITMVECGFVSAGTKTAKDSLQKSMKLEYFVPPPGWDAMVASLSYTHKSYAGFSCTLVLVSMGDLKQILVSFPKQDVEISTKVSVNDYVVEQATFSAQKPVAIADLCNVSKLAQKLRNELLVPLQLAAHRILDLPSPFHLAGLPAEILLHTLQFLDIRWVLNVSETCRRLHDSCLSDALWQHLYKRDLGSPPSSAGYGPSWMALYKERYMQRTAYNIGWHQPLPPYYGDIPQPRIYPTGPMHPHSPGFPYHPAPIGPYPVVPDPSRPFNPYRDPDSPYFGEDIPNHPPHPLSPSVPYPSYPGIGPLGPGGRDPLNPFGDPQFGGLGPGLPGGQARRPRGPGSVPDFRFI